MRNRVMAAGEPTVDVRFCLVFPRETISVPVVRRVLGDTLYKLGVNEECVADLLLAVTEACTNVLRHSGPGCRYEVVATVGRNRCVLDVVDTGRGFDPASLRVNRPSARSVLLFRRRTTPLPQWPYPGPSRPSAMRHRLSRVSHRAERRALAQLPESGRGPAIMRACGGGGALPSRARRGA